MSNLIMTLLLRLLKKSVSNNLLWCLISKLDLLVIQFFSYCKAMNFQSETSLVTIWKSYSNTYRLYIRKIAKVHFRSSVNSFHNLKVSYSINLKSLMMKWFSKQSLKHLDIWSYSLLQLTAITNPNKTFRLYLYLYPWKKIKKTFSLDIWLLNWSKELNLYNSWLPNWNQDS